MVIRLGLVDCDTSHVVAFTQRLNHVDVDEDHWVDGARVVAAVPLPSLVSPERVDGFTDQLRAYRLEILAQPLDLLGNVDAVLIESVDGSVHRERAMPFIEAGVPVWVDKPFACSTADAKALVAAAQQRGVPLFSASALRFDLPVQDVLARRGELGEVIGIDVFTGAALHPRNPGLFHYGVHGVETIYALMGSGCARVRCIRADGVDAVVGEWQDGRVATLRGIRRGAGGFGFTVFAENQIVSARASQYFYREVLKQIVRTFETGQSPVSGDEMIEVVAFQEAVNHSLERGGDPVALPR